MSILAAISAVSSGKFEVKRANLLLKSLLLAWWAILPRNLQEVHKIIRSDTLFSLEAADFFNARGLRRQKLLRLIWIIIWIIDGVGWII